MIARGAMTPRRDCRAIHVDEVDLWHFLLESVRYSMGRMSTAPATTCAALRRYWVFVTPQQREQIRREIEQELVSCERVGKTLGMACDHKTWRDMAEWAKAHQ